MRKLLSVILVSAFVICTATAALADVKQYVPFNNMSAAGVAVKYSQTFNVAKFPNKTLHVTGVNLAGTAFKNMSGTLIAQCSPNQGEPWNGAGRWQDSVGTAVSLTANSTVTWKDYCSYMRLKWTSGTVGGKLKAWLNISE